MTQLRKLREPALFSAAWFCAFGALAYSTLPGTADPQAQRVSHPATPVTVRRQAEQSIDFIVRFDDGVDAIEACLERPRDEIDTAREIFAEWAGQQPALSGVALKRVKYSGEMLLTWHTGLKRPLLRADVNLKLAQIKAMPSVRYADPDFTFQPGGDAK